MLLDRDMADQRSRPLQHSVGVGKECTAIKTKIHVTAIGYDVAKAVLKWFASE